MGARHRLAVTVAAVAVLLAGCTGPTVDPLPRPGPTRSVPDPCATPTIRVAGVPPTPSVESAPDPRPVERGTPTATGVYRRVIGGGHRVEEVLDAPVVPVLGWRRPPVGVDQERVWSELVARASVRRQPSPGLAGATSLMDGVAERRGTYLTYVGVGRRTVRFTAMCGGQLYEGTAETWTDPQGGAIDCARPVDDASPLTRSVHAEYC